MRHGGILAPQDHLLGRSLGRCAFLSHQGRCLEKRTAPCVQLLSVWSTLERAGEGRGGSRVRFCLLSRPGSADENIAGADGGEAACLLVGVGVMVSSGENSSSPVLRAGNHTGLFYLYLLPFLLAFLRCYHSSQCLCLKTRCQSRDAWESRREQESRSLAQRVYCRHDPSLCNLSQPLALHFSVCILRETQICLPDYVRQ